MRMSIKRNLKQLRISLFLFVVSCGFLLLSVYSIVFMVVFAVIFCFFCMPSFLIHLFYFLEDSRKEIQLSEDRILIKMNQTLVEFRNEDVDCICIHKTRNELEVGFKRFPSDNYRYAEIGLVDGRKFKITCLIIHDLESFFTSRFDSRVKYRVGNFFIW